ncbi:MAG: ATP-dependent 6-phosphofructokinase [Chloroflexi bacterium]|nr:ATP-dependent 6-phosphofructokinase [Chloroflexota bacterium]
MGGDDIKRIGILTGGGDAPGLNAVIRAVALTARNRYGWEVVGIRQGFDGLLNGALPQPMASIDMYDLLARGGTILGAVNRGNPLVRAVEQPDGTVAQVDISDEIVGRINALALDAVVAAGGDGTMAIAHQLVQHGARIVGVPKTIDNDLDLTDVTFGFDTAILTATEALDKLQTTAESHDRVMVLEVMGRNSGWIALKTGVAGGADAILIPEIPYDIRIVCEKIQTLRRAGRVYSLVVVAEGAAPIDGEQEYYIKGSGMMEGRLGGIGFHIGNILAECTDAEVRVTVLGHVQRGGPPTPRDRWLATRFGSAAVHLIAEQRWGEMVALQGTQLVSVPMERAMQLKTVDPDGAMVQMARDLGIVFG